MTTALLEHFARTDPTLAKLVAQVGDCELARSNRATVFEALARSIASQQLSGLVAAKIIGRLMTAHDEHFPTPQLLLTMTPEALRAVGFSFAKIAALRDLATKTLDGSLPSDEQLAAMDDEAIIERCVAVRGIGRWTVEMLLMFHLQRADVLPVDDFGVRQGFQLLHGLKGMPTPKALLAYGERWRPHRSAAAWYLWRAVDLHRLGTLPPHVGRAPRVAIVAPRPAVKKKKKTGKKKASAARRA